MLFRPDRRLGSQPEVVSAVASPRGGATTAWNWSAGRAFAVGQGDAKFPPFAGTLCATFVIAWIVTVPVAALIATAFRNALFFASLFNGDRPRVLEDIARFSRRCRDYCRNKIEETK